MPYDLYFTGGLLALLLIANIFYKKMYLDFCLFLLPLGISYQYFVYGYPAFTYVNIVMLLISGFHLIQLSKMRK